MAYCESGKRNCSTHTSALGFPANAQERTNNKDAVESVCQDGLDLAQECGELALCGFESYVAHSDEMRITREIKDGESYAT